MNQRFILFRRAGVFYCEDTTTGKRTSLRTKDQSEALKLVATCRPLDIDDPIPAITVMLPDGD